MTEHEEHLLRHLRTAHPQGIQDEPTPAQTLERLNSAIQVLATVPAKTARRVRRPLERWERYLFVSTCFAIFAIWGPDALEVKAFWTTALFAVMAVVFAFTDEDPEEYDDDDR